MKHIYSYLFLPFLFFLFACSDTEENLIDPYLTVELENNVFNVPTMTMDYLPSRRSFSAH